MLPQEAPHASTWAHRPARFIGCTLSKNGRDSLQRHDRYITELFAAFDKIEGHGVPSRPIPAEFEVEGFYFRHVHHFVYWCRLSTGDIGIVTILNERMHQTDRFRDGFGG